MEPESSISNIYTYLNIPNHNKKLSEEAFQGIVDNISICMYEYGFDRLLQDYLSTYMSKASKDWALLKKKTIGQNYLSSTSTTGMAIIKKYMTHIYDVKNYKGVCIRDLWTVENIKKVLFINRKTHSTPYVSEIIRQLGFMSGTSKVTIYRPLLTKRIVQYYQAKNVLDVCVGWGGRMVGTASLPNVHYTGIEPSTKTFQGLMNIKKDLSLEKVVLHHDTAENILPTLEKGFYDLAITSPPYYNLEIYSDEENQSHHYGSYEEWYKRFLRPVVYGVLETLTEKGYSCWSVKNFKTDKNYSLYDDIVALHKEKGWIKQETEFYIGNSVRPGLKDAFGNAKKSQEVTYIFCKI